MAGANTILLVPPGVTVYTATGTAAVPGPVTVIPASSDVATALPGGFALYLPFSHTISPATVNISALIHQLATGVPVGPLFAPFYGSGTPASAIAASLQSFSLPTDNTIFVPYTAALPLPVTVSSLINALSAPGAVFPAVTSTAIVTSTPSPNSIPTPTSSTPTGSSPANPASAHPTPANSTPANEVQEGTFTGAVVGGVLGGFILGLVACSLIVLCCMRRRSSARVHHDTLMEGDNSKIEKTQVFTATSEVTGWQKYMPQETDDRTITRAFQSVFDQVQAHVEGFYGAKSNNVSSRAITSLESIWPDDLPAMLLQTDHFIPLLEGILIRWILHRVSLRSNTDESLLPQEYTQTPSKNRWHMERDDQEVGLTSESRRGFSQALSHWRMLTGFLHPDPGRDPDFTRSLEVKIERATFTLVEAFSPWDIPGKSDHDRRESLRKILQQASSAGILLFTQPSTFMFDWSKNHRGGDRSMLVVPAFVKRLDSSAESLNPVQVLIEARWANIRSL